MQTTWSAAAAVPRIQSGEVSLVLLDLEAFSPTADISTWFAELPTECRPMVLGFGPHVDQGRLENALQSGCDAVYSRGKMHRDTMALVQSALAANPCQ